MRMDDLLKAAAGALGGAVIAWGANSLTLVGRVDAIERAQLRIESMLVQLVERRGERP